MTVMKALPLIPLIAAITFACRALPLLLLPSRPFGWRTSIYPRYLPLGVLAALAAVAIRPQGRAGTTIRLGDSRRLRDPGISIPPC